MDGAGGASSSEKLIFALALGVGGDMSGGCERAGWWEYAWVV